MLSEQEIQQALHARRVVPLSVANPHGPLGLEHLAEAVAQVLGAPGSPPQKARVRRPIELPLETWEKLDHLAQVATRTTMHPVTASEIAAALLERFVTTAQ
jgi:hypothetical protein